MSQFIEMFGNPVTNNKGWNTLPIKDVAPETSSLEKQTGKVWILNLDMIESNTGKVVEKVFENDSNLLSVAPFDEGNVLYSKLRPYLNKVVIPDGKGYATTELVPLRPNQKLLNLTFFSHLLRGDDFVTYANSISTGTKMPRMPLNDLRKFQCILPPMEKQNEFEEIAHQADKSGFDGRKSQFIEMFGDFHNKVQIKDVCLVVSGKSIPTKLEDIDGNNPYIKVADFNIPGNEKYITIAQRYVSDDSASYSKQIPEGSVIFAKNGAASMSNKKRLTKIRCCIDMNTMAVFPKNESILSDFLFATIEAMDVSSHVRQGAIPSISPKSIEDSYIAMPTMEEQYRYVSIAKHTDKSGSVLQHMIAC